MNSRYRLKNVCALLALGLLANSAAAQPATDPGLAHRREMVHRYMVATHFEERVKSMTATIMPMMLEQTRKQYPGVPEKVMAAIESSATEAMDDLTPKVESRFGDLIAAKFSDDELQQVTAFYESPVGQKILLKSAELMSAVQPMMRELLPGVQADMLHRLCGKIDCSTLPKPAKT